MQHDVKDLRILIRAGAWEMQPQATESKDLFPFHLSYLDGYAGFIDQDSPLYPMGWTKTAMMPYDDSELTNPTAHIIIYQSQFNGRRVLKADSVIIVSRITPVPRFGLMQPTREVDPRYLGQRQYGAISRQKLASQ
ncbi:hypothetical protein PG996_007909 [Apiospora saccharicola]|uniref:Uncharacterized protein n=1 Tax=Apiospora saccharicola TaxID=335842 RepID=A0ABR1UWF6_9PEZI